MSSTGVNKTRSTDSRTADVILDADRIQIESEKIFKETGDSNMGNSPGLANTLTAAGNFLSKNGDLRSGPMGNDIGIIEIINDAIEIALGFGTYEPSLVLNGEGGATDILSTITPGTNVFLNQELLVQAGSFAITLREILVTGNLLTPGGVDVVLEPGDMARLIFSPVVGQKWIVLSVSSGSGTGVAFPFRPPKEDLSPAIAFNQVIDISTNTGNAKQIQFPAGDIGLQISGDPANTLSQKVDILFIQDAVGGRSLSTVDSAIKNGGLMDTLLDKTPNAKTLFRLATLDGGVSYHANLVDLTTASGSVEFPINFPVEDLGTLGDPSDPIYNFSWLGTNRHAKKALIDGPLTITIGTDLPTNTLGLTIFKLKQDSNGGHVVTFTGIANASPSIDSTPNNTTYIGVQRMDGESLAFTIGDKIFIGSTGEQWSEFPAVQPVNMANNSFLNFIGWTTSKTGQGFGVNINGFTSFLPTGDIYKYQINGFDRFTISESGLDVHNLSMTRVAAIAIVDVGSGISRGNITGDPGSAAMRISIASGEKLIISDVISNIAEFDKATGLKMINDINLNTFDMYGIDSLTFQTSSGTLFSLNVGFSALGGGGFRANVLDNTGKFEITNENTVHFEFDAVNNNINIIDSLFSVIDTFSETSFGILKGTNSTQLSDPTRIDFQIAGTTGVSLVDNGIIFTNNRFIAGLSQIGFSILGNIIENDSGGMIFKTVPGDDFTWGDGTDIFGSIDKDLFAINAMPMQFTEITEPSDPGLNTLGKLFHNSVNNRLSYKRRNDGDTAFEVVSLESGAGANTALSNLVAPTAVNVALLPDVTGRDFGSNSKSWDGFFSNLFITNNSQLPSTQIGEFERNGNVVGLYAGTFTVVDYTTTPQGTANFVSFRDNTSPSTGDELGSLRFDGRDNGNNRIQYARIIPGIGAVNGDFGILALQVRADNSGLVTGLQLTGDDNVANRSYLQINARINSDLVFGFDGVGSLAAKISPVGASTTLQIVVQDNVSFTNGSAGMLASPAIPSLVPSLATLDAVFGNHVGAHGVFNTGLATPNIGWKTRSDEWVVIAVPAGGGPVIGEHFN